jgi:hypothetical protein
MNTALKFSAPLVLGALGALALAAPATAQRRAPAAPMADIVNHNPIFYAEVGLRGPDSFTAVLDKAKGELCYMVNAPSIPTANGAAITDASGKTVVKLATLTGTSGGGCATVAGDLSSAMLANPGNYMIEVSSAADPDGAASGTLSMLDPDTKLK